MGKEREDGKDRVSKDRNKGWIRSDEINKERKGSDQMRWDERDRKESKG